MWVDGIEIERLKENGSCYLVDDNYIVVTDSEGRIIFSFNLEFNGVKTENLQKDVAQKTILRYDIIRKIQEDSK